MLVSILIDQNVISHGDVLSNGKCNDILGYARKPVPKGWQEEGFNCLPTISALAKSKDLYRYFELNMEK